jgi:hypothetical protein
MKPSTVDANALDSLPASLPNGRSLRNEPSDAREREATNRNYFTCVVSATPLGTINVAMALIG